MPVGKQEGHVIMTRADAMEYLKVSRSTLKRLVDRGQIPFYKLGEKPNQKGVAVRFRKQDLDRFLESCRVEF